ncbi:MAG: ABC transporter substrate-binding protein [Chloroflexota bacterium]
MDELSRPAGNPDRPMGIVPLRHISRRAAVKRLSLAVAGGVLIPLAAACAQQAPAPNKPAEPSKPAEAKPAAQSAAPKAEVKPAEPAKPVGEPKAGGTLKVAIIGEPPHLDPQFGTQTVTADVMWHVYETLFARNSKEEAVPHLLEKYEASADGLSAKLMLRRGVLFHDGKEMTATDVIASLKRYGALAARGKTILDRVETLGSSDKYAVDIKFKQPTAGILPTFLSQRDALIMSSETAEAFPKDKAIRPIGTGPYSLLEHVPDRHVRLGRFDKYSARTDPADGSSGKRVAYVDEVRFIPVPEESVRVDGVGTGEYDYADTLAPDSYDRIKALPNVSADIGKPYYWSVFHFNKKEGLFTNVKLRQAILAGLSIDPIARAAFGRPDFYRVGPEIAAPETAWYTDEGKDLYNKGDVEKAKSLMKDAGYAGEVVRILSTKEYPYNYNGALPFKQQLEGMGFKVDLQVMDWATVGKRRADSKEFEIHVTGHSSYVHPVMQPYMAPTWPGWWVSEERDKLASAIMAETDLKKQMDLIRQIQALTYREVPGIKYGEYFALRARSNKLQGMKNPSDPFFWNAWLA